MCGRYALAPPRRISKADLEYLRGIELFEPVYNVAPSMTMPIVRMIGGQPKLTPAKWGLVPFWAKDPKIGYKLINARAETVAEKPSFKYAYKARRCLVPASGYFEWQQRPGGKQPYYFTSRDDSLLAFAGLWEYWKPEGGGEGLVTYAVIVCEPNALSADIHDRMPVVIDPKDWQAWLTADDPSALLKPCPGELLRRHAVGSAVNRPENEGPQLIEPIDDPKLL